MDRNMYTLDCAKSHIKRCMIASRKNPESFFRVSLLAVGSIRIYSNIFWIKYINQINALYEKGHSLTDIDKDIPFMRMKMKQNAINYLHQKKEYLHAQITELNADQYHDMLCTTVPGLGPTKAAFIVQMIYGELGCFDAVNIKRIGRTLSKVPHIYRSQLRNEINETSEELWFKWCITVAERETKNGTIWCPYGLSKAHALFIEDGFFRTDLIKK